MDTVTKLKLKSVFLRAALHLQTVPMLLIPSVMFLMDKHLMTREGFIKFIENRKSPAPVVPKNHPVYELIAPLARKAGIEVLSVVTQGAYAAVHSKNNYAQFSFSQRALDDVSENTAFITAVIGHELTHASRGIYTDFFPDSQCLALFTGVGFYYPLALLVPALAPAAAVIGAVSIFSAYGIPKLSRILQRNEEYLADIGSGELTGDPHSMAGFLKAYLPADELLRQRVKNDEIKQPRYGGSHPWVADRIGVLCDVFNMRAEDLTAPVISARPQLPPPPPHDLLP